MGLSWGGRLDWGDLTFLLAFLLVMARVDRLIINSLLGFHFGHSDRQN